LRGRCPVGQRGAPWSALVRPSVTSIWVKVTPSELACPMAACPRTGSSASRKAPSHLAQPKSASHQAVRCFSSVNRRTPTSPFSKQPPPLASSPMPPTRARALPLAPACASGRIATRDIAETIAAENADILDFTLHISGCAKGCAHPGPAALTVIGGENGAGLVVNATAKALPAGYRPGYDAARGIGRVAAVIRSARLPGETAAACLTRLGTAGIAEAYRQE
jgi:hypothetical protein